MPDPHSIFSSGGAETVIALLTPDKSPQGSRIVPQTWRLTEQDLRIGKSESAHMWFRRLIGSESSDERIDQCAINPNFALFGSVQWENGLIKRCGFQALITEASLNEFYIDDRLGSSYFRLDFDPSQPGPFFREPQPHVHCKPHGPPRVPFLCVQGEYVLISFLEFIFLNFFYEDWLAWAKRASRKAITPDTFDAIVESYNSEPQRLHQLAPDLETLKQRLFEAKRERAPGVHALLPSASMLSYLHVAVNPAVYESEPTEDELK